MKLNPTCYSEGHAPFFRLVARDGTAIAINYAHRSLLRYSPATGITIPFGQHPVRIQGTGLLPLFKLLAGGDIAEIRACDPQTTPRKDGEPFVSSITQE